MGSQTHAILNQSRQGSLTVPYHHTSHVTRRSQPCNVTQAHRAGTRPDTNYSDQYIVFTHNGEEQRARHAAPRSALWSGCGACCSRWCSSGARTWLFSTTVPIFGFEEASSLTAQIAALSIPWPNDFIPSDTRAVTGLTAV